jgi:hypothetical protein
MVIPNGIPAGLLRPVSAGRLAALRRVLAADEDTTMLFRVGRFDPAKRWLMVVDVAVRLKEMGHRVVFPLRRGSRGTATRCWRTPGRRCSRSPTSAVRRIPGIKR